MEEMKIKELLIKENKEFRKAFDQHQKLEKKLVKFRSKNYLSDEEKWEERQLKIKKLMFKDKMYSMMTEYKKSLP
jgi:uncharacterized protein YdcH (DUF465 family)